MNAEVSLAVNPPSSLAMPDLASAVERTGGCSCHMTISRVMHAGDHLFRSGEVFSDFHIVRSGSYKCYTLDPQGQERVSGFRFPGEPLALGAISAGRRTVNAVALETSTVWTAPYGQFSRVMLANESLRAQFFNMLSRELGKAAVLACDFTAEERVAGFLLDMSRTSEQRGFSATQFNLSMSRREIANYLRLAVETVTRVLTSFRELALIDVDRRSVRLLDLPQLRRLGSSLGAPTD